MNSKLLKLSALSIFLAAAAPVSSFAQTATEQKAGKEIKVGSTVLTQTGNDPYCWNNGPYTYEKVMEIPNTSKKEIYSRVKEWIAKNLKTSSTDIFYDDEHNDRIALTTRLILKDQKILQGQSVEFKINIAFKDNKLKLEASSFIYYGHEALTTGYDYQKELHDLKAVYKREKPLVKSMFEDFDERFVAMRKSMKAAAMSSAATASDNW